MRSIAEISILVLLIISAFFAAQAQRNTETISLTATVSGESGFLKNLSAEDFEVYLENKRGSVDLLKQEDEPVSIGFLVDVSASMRSYRSRKPDKMAFGVKGFSSLLTNANRENDYFVMSFAKSVNLVLDSTPETEKVKKSLNLLAEDELREWETKFYEAVKNGFGKIQSAKNKKRVLILVTDGQDTDSKKLNFGDMEKLVRQNDVLFYVVRVIPDEFFEDSRELALSLRKYSVLERDYNKLQFEVAPFPTGISNDFLDSIRMLEDLSAKSGGRVFYPLNQAEADKAFEILADELKSQYWLAINPPPALKKDRVSEVRIKIPKLKDQKKVLVRTRKEIYF